MAAAIAMIGPIIGALVPTIPSIIKIVEGLFREPGSGETKMKAAIEVAKVLINTASESKATGDPELNDVTTPLVVPPDQLKGVIETVFQQMQASGALDSDEKAIYLLRGSVEAINLEKI